MLLLAGGVAFLVIMLIAKGVRIVPQAENWIVESFGKYRKTLEPGLNLLNPIFDKVPYKIDIREQLLDLPAQSIITADNATVIVDGVVFFRIMDPYKASYGIENLNRAIANLGLTNLRSILGRLTLDESFSSRDKINTELLQALDEATDAWGTKVTRVEIKDIAPPQDLREAMDLQKKAEQEKRAAILEADAKRESQEREAEGFKKAQILKAEARKEAAMRDAEARERLALAEAKAIQMITQALESTKGDPMTYLLGQEYIKGLSNISQSENSKMVIFPADVLESIKSVFKKS